MKEKSSMKRIYCYRMALKQKVKIIYRTKFMICMSWDKPKPGLAYTSAALSPSVADLKYVIQNLLRNMWYKTCPVTIVVRSGLIPFILYPFQIWKYEKQYYMKVWKTILYISWTKQDMKTCKLHSPYFSIVQYQLSYVDFMYYIYWWQVRSKSMDPCTHWPNPTKPLLKLPLIGAGHSFNLTHCHPYISDQKVVIKTYKGSMNLMVICRFNWKLSRGISI